MHPRIAAAPRFIAAPALVLALLAGRAAKPDFSGEWRLDKARSTFGIAQAAAVESAVVRIAHHEPHFSFSRTFFVGGREDTLSWALTTDGAAVTGREGAQSVTSRLDWDADTLVYATRTVTSRGIAGDTVRYALLDGGRTLRAAERFRAPRLSYDNLWIFEKR